MELVSWLEKHKWVVNPDRNSVGPLFGQRNSRPRRQRCEAFFRTRRVSEGPLPCRRAGYEKSLQKAVTPLVATPPTWH